MFAIAEKTQLRTNKVGDVKERKERETKIDKKVHPWKHGSN
jgi:hypothetical protein